MTTPPASTDDPDVYLELDDVDLTNCDREQLHVMGTIQPHGVLLVVDDEGQVVVASANAASMLGADGPVQGRDIRDLLDDAPDTAPLVEQLRLASPRSRLGRARLHDGGLVDLITHTMQDHTIVELEPATPKDVGMLLSDVGSAVATLSAKGSLAAARDLAAAAVRQITGFDRVMIYEFHADGHGEVVAESRRPDLEPFLGLHYPAADIPKQARLLYVRSWTRLIADVDATPSPLEPQQLPSGAPVNLAQAQLRAVSPIHIEYLQNMGVGASLSLSLVDDGELVGLIACHATEARRVPFVARAAAELMARLLSEQFARARAAEAVATENDRRRAQISVLRRVAEARSPAAALSAIGEDTMALFGAHGFTGRIGDDVGEAGDAAPVALVEQLLATVAPDDVVAVDDLTALGGTGDLDGGILAVAIRDGSFLAWRRHAVAQTVSWGGDPYENVQANGDRLTPRGSFDVWTETMASACEAWTSRDRQLAQSLRRTLVAEPDPGDGYHVIEALAAYAEDLEAANADLRKVVDQREELVSAVAHDLRGPMRTLSAMTELLGSRLDSIAADDPKIDMMTTSISRSARQLEDLLDGIQRWARLDDQIAVIGLDLRQTIETVLGSLRSEITDAGAVVDTGELHAVLGDAVLVRQAVQNLVANAVRYRSDDRDLHIRISSERDGDDVVLHIEDNGLGIPVENQAEVFAMFRRVPGVERGGTGIGLALVQRAAEVMHGSVSLDSMAGVGTTVHLRLPAGAAS